MKLVDDVDFQKMMLDPFSFYEMLHNEKVTACRENKKTWGVFKYDEVSFVLKRDDIFSSRALNRVMNPEWLVKDCQRTNIITSKDRPESEKNRRLINRLFIKKRINALFDFMQNTAASIANELPKNQAINFIQAFSYPYISFVINRFLGTAFDFSGIRQWIVAVEGMSELRPDNKDAIEKIIRHQRMEFISFIEEKKKNPGTDFISQLILAHGTNLNDSDLLDIAELLVSAGYHTTVHILSNIIVFFSYNKNTKNLVSKDKTLIPAFVDEILRMFPALHFTVREAIVDFEMPGGYTIKKGEYVKAMIAAANRDPDIFTNPSQFNMFRHNNREHLAFGTGTHVCLGMALAHAEICAAVEAIVQQFSDITISEQSNSYIAMPTLAGLSRLDILIT